MCIVNMYKYILKSIHVTDAADEKPGFKKSQCSFKNMVLHIQSTVIKCVLQLFKHSGSTEAQL